MTGKEGCCLPERGLKWYTKGKPDPLGGDGTLKKMTLRIVTLVIGAWLLLSLTGCAPVILGMGAAGGYYYHKGRVLKNQDASTQKAPETTKKEAPVQEPAKPTK